jgi:hypothetical protein
MTISCSGLRVASCQQCLYCFGYWPDRSVSHFAFPSMTAAESIALIESLGGSVIRPQNPYPYPYMITHPLWGRISYGCHHAKSLARQAEALAKAAASEANG